MQAQGQPQLAAQAARRSRPHSGLSRDANNPGHMVHSHRLEKGHRLQEGQSSSYKKRNNPDYRFHSSCKSRKDTSEL